MIRLSEAHYRAVKKMTRAECANNDCGNCLLLDDGDACVCVQAISYSLLCRYFREAVLPLDPVLEAALTAEGNAPETRPCPICGGAVLADGRMRYCSPACAGAALRKQKREYMRKKRG